MTELSPLRRPYSVPELVVHGTVQELTLGKSGPDDDADGGSFIPRNIDGQEPSDS